MTPALDTSGAVPMSRTFFHPLKSGDAPIVWSDLSPFAQGYIEAAFESLAEQSRTGVGSFARYAFSDLAPEALALILADCGAIRRTRGTGTDMVVRDLGASTWRARQRGISTAFPPLTVTFDNDAKVRLS